MRYTPLLAAIMLSVAIGGSTAALATDDDDASKPGHLNVPSDKWLSPTQITEKLQQKGYTVTEIEIDDGAYEVEMIDKRTGTRIEGHVHPATGELMLGYDD
jgi:hypothetical protein